MGRRIIIEQDTPSASDVVIEIVSSVGGIALGAGAGMYLNQFLPVATTTMENVVRRSTVYLGSFTIGVAGAKAIQSEMEDARDAAIMATLVAKGVLKNEEAKEAQTEETPKNTTKK